MQLFACFHGFGALALGRVSPRFAWSCGPGATYDRRQLGSSESTLAQLRSLAPQPGTTWIGAMRTT